MFYMYTSEYVTYYVKKRHVARKAWVIARIFFNLTMIANMLTTDLKT